MKIDLLKIFGVACCTPLAVNILNLLVADIEIGVTLLYRVLSSLPFTILGLKVLIRAIDMAEEVDNGINA